MEIYKNIENYENLYQVTSYGRVYSLISKNFLKPKKNKGGYLCVGLCKNGKQKWYYLHRLVATAFIPNPLNLPEVNHKSEVKSENRVENLEWCDCKYNINYGTARERMAEKLSKPILQFTKEGKFVKEYPSTWEAARQTKIDQSSISKCCNSKLHSAGNYLWRYKKKEEAV